MTGGGAEAPTLEQVKREAIKKLKDEGGLSGKAVATLNEQITEYIKSLVIHAKRLAKAQGSDRINPQHIVHSAQYLASGTRPRGSKVVGPLGWALLGMWLPRVIEAAMEGERQLHLIWVAFAVVGACCLIWDYAKS